jgi:hypothetical protein
MEEMLSEGMIREAIRPTVHKSDASTAGGCNACCARGVVYVISLGNTEARVCDRCRKSLRDQLGKP